MPDVLTFPTPNVPDTLTHDAVPVEAAKTLVIHALTLLQIQARLSRTNQEFSSCLQTLRECEGLAVEAGNRVSAMQDERDGIAG